MHPNAPLAVHEGARAAGQPLAIHEGRLAAGQVTADHTLGALRVDVTPGGGRWYSAWAKSGPAALALLRTAVASLDAGDRLGEPWLRSVAARSTGGLGAVRHADNF